ncbi:MAG: arabinan endo-1,5-alpha-L-arabinosidase [Tannerella sp.]|jgi:arabinan endo-1,5-alpha-L-arabinosidase|nr:arabinan endo-1,5-alpha-L-arabinosidase [Tannerella sp.]
MKQHIIPVLFLVFYISGCHQATFKPTPNPNPWEDNYLAISGMEHYKHWGAYNVHDPACKKIGGYYYTYSTDAIYNENRKEAAEKEIPIGYIQIRKSKDLVDWEFVGWALSKIPREATEWVHQHSGGREATNIWAPYIVQHNDVYRLYYCVSAFGRKTSYIGLAESPSPEGPWDLKGCVVRTDNESIMNAIDPSVIVDPETGKWWMHYGSFFGGLFCVELDPATGLTKTENDQGHLIARRANYRKDNLEAPEIIYHPGLKKYFLFYSYDPLMTTYNVRVSRSNSPEGPFYNFSDKDVRDTINSFPILTAPYRFEGHSGWAGVAHCGVVEDNGRYFMLHQARLSPQNQLMVLHIREIFFNSDGWPVVSPERYAGTTPRSFRTHDIAGEWEMIRIIEPLHERQLEAGQILWGEGELKDKECNKSFKLDLRKNGSAGTNGKWSFTEQKQILKLTIDNEEIQELIIFAGQDWENEQETILFTGLDSRGRSVWGKRVK